MTFSIKQLLIQISLLAIVLGFFQNPTLLSCAGIAAIFSLAYANSLGQETFEFGGVLGAVIGWILPILFNVGVEHCGYFTGAGSPPYFDGDGPLWGGLGAPLLWFLFTVVPVSMMGWAIGASSRFLHMKFNASAKLLMKR